MRIIKFILQKEFLQIFRNKAMIPIIFIMPVVQLLILSNAATYDIKNIKFCVIDYDQSRFSRELVSKFANNGYFILTDYFFSINSAEESFRKNQARMIIHIPREFEKNYRTNGTTKIQFIINGEDATSAGITLNYANVIVNQFAVGIIPEFYDANLLQNNSLINISYSNWFNPELDYRNYMVPGILVVLVTVIGMFLSGMNIVKEKELGTIEQLNVTPIKKSYFIIGKLLPFWIIGLFDLAFGLTLGKIVFGIPIIGSPFLIFLIASAYLLVVLGIGLFISTVTETQQQSMFVSWFFMVVFILLGGIFTPVESMPYWAQKITLFNPVAYFSRVMRMIMLKGSGFFDIFNALITLILYAIGILTLAIFRYRKTS